LIIAAHVRELQQGVYNARSALGDRRKTAAKLMRIVQVWETFPVAASALAHHAGRHGSESVFGKAASR
jgi:hypothetical protein